MPRLDVILHVPRTGGSYLLGLLRESCNRQGRLLLAVPSPEVGAALPHMIEGAERAIVIGHHVQRYNWPGWTVRHYAMLRDPYQRYASYVAWRVAQGYTTFDTHQDASELIRYALGRYSVGSTGIGYAERYRQFVEDLYDKLSLAFDVQVEPQFTQHDVTPSMRAYVEVRCRGELQLWEWLTSTQ